ncbi:protein BRANCHLESS TRICHOME [Elaeis guineensis]|uniref:Protein BRANCHLESS TRICHOME n=1 Tax=Elaeis guineensis var. tenera TaxID=51953 RepID=A0A6I9R218_ELAGV|nr:protein BRANCHLESS TRICHOME [Elaeis guineensis]
MEGSLINLRNPPDAGSIITTLPTWKLYDNPHYSQCCNDSTLHLHSSNCISSYVQMIFASKLETSPVGEITTFLGPMDCDGTPSELEVAQGRINELKAELEFERRMRRKAESLNKVMVREMMEERKAREAAHALCKRLEEELARKQEEVDRVLRDIDEERKMMRIAEVWREERVQMKLAEARLLMEEKLQEMAANQSKREMPKKGEEVGELKVNTVPSFQRGSCENAENFSEVGSAGQASQPSQQRREPENPHIKRGIKGFVEFPRVVRVHSSSKEARVHLGSNLECQRAQLRILLRHRNPVGLGLLGNSENLVM